MSLVDSLRTSSPRQKILLIAIAAVALLAASAAVYFLVLRTPYSVLFSRLRPADAAAIVAELEKKKTPFRLEDGGATILVPAKLVDATRLNVVSEDLPLKGNVGFELFNKSDMGLTEFAQKINYQRALQGELSRTIMAIDTVDSARVHLSLPDPSLFRDDHRPPKASVTLIPRPGQQITPETVRGIQRLVAYSTPDLDVANVVVIDQHGALISAETAAVAPASTVSPAEARVVQFYADRVKAALARATPGVDLSVVAHAVAPPKDGSDAPDLAALIANWTPDARDVGVEIAITSSAPLTPRQQEQARAAAAEAIGLNAGLGDQISISTSPAALTDSTPGLRSTAGSGDPAQSARPVQTTAPTSAPTIFWYAVLAPVLLAALFIAAMLLRRNKPSRLSVAQREAFARRLQEALDKEDAHVARRV